MISTVAPTIEKPLARMRRTCRLHRRIHDEGSLESGDDGVSSFVVDSFGQAIQVGSESNNTGLIIFSVMTPSTVTAETWISANKTPSWALVKCLSSGVAECRVDPAKPPS